MTNGQGYGFRFGQARRSLRNTTDAGGFNIQSNVDRFFTGGFAFASVLCCFPFQNRRITAVGKEAHSLSSRCWFPPDFQFGMHHFRYFADDFNCLPHMSYDSISFVLATTEEPSGIDGLRSFMMHENGVREELCPWLESSHLRSLSSNIIVGGGAAVP